MRATVSAEKTKIDVVMFKFQPFWLKSRPKVFVERVPVGLGAMELLQTGQRDLNWVSTMQERLSESCQGMRVRHRADTVFLLVMGGRILTMQTGFAMLES
eukprot:1655367-Amphidinium_carterae.1